MAVEFSSSCRPTSSGERRSAKMPEPTTTATRSAGADGLGGDLAGERGGHRLSSTVGAGRRRLRRCVGELERARPATARAASVREPVVGPVPEPLDDSTRPGVAQDLAGGGSRAAGARRAPRRGGRRRAPRSRAARTIRQRTGSASGLDSVERRRIHIDRHRLWMFVDVIGMRVKRTAATGPVAQPPRTSRSCGEALGDDGAVDPAADLLLGDQPGVGEDDRWWRHGRLALADRLLEVAAARGALGRGGDQRQQPEPHRVGERLERAASSSASASSSGAASSGAQQAARCVASFFIADLLHPSTLSIH